MPRHYRKIPPHVRRQLSAVEGERFVVAGCVVVTRAVDLQRGELSHLDITVDDSGLYLEPEILPPARAGKFSARNTDGWIEVRYDLPKEPYSVSLEAPNWHGSGTHTVYQHRERYPKICHGPQFATIRVECRDTTLGRESYALKFEVSTVLDVTAPDFEQQLLESINLLQENVGLCGVAKPHTSFAEYAESLRLQWEVLPPGTREEAMARIFSGRTPTPAEVTRVGDRFDFLMGLRPAAMIYGRSGFQRYFGAQLHKDLVLFENVEHGNAMYVMFDDWEQLSQKSRLELMSGRYGQGFERVVHSGDWKDRLRRILAVRRERPEG
jgi:hypothetical protein